MRKSFSAELMAKVALDAIKEEKTIAELSSQYEAHRTQITNWRKRALEGLVGIFQEKAARTLGEKEKVFDETVRLMHRVDEIFTEYPFYGSRRIREALRREGFEIGRERVQAFMRQMGLRAIYPKGNLSKKQPGHKIYPYLLADIEITYPNQVWASV